MKRIDDDAFYEYIKQYDPDSEYHSVGEVDYHLLSDDKPYENPPERRVSSFLAVYSFFVP